MLDMKFWFLALFLILSLKPQVGHSDGIPQDLSELLWELSQENSGENSSEESSSETASDYDGDFYLSLKNGRHSPIQTIQTLASLGFLPLVYLEPQKRPPRS